VIALLSSGVAPFSAGPNRLPKIAIPAIALVFAGLAFLVYGISRTVANAQFPAAGSNLGPVGTADVFGSIADFGKALFTTYLLPFEATALILMVAVIGVVLLAGDQTPYMPTRKRAGQVERSMREGILRGGKR
jgi:NADH:ubiquinone oxidoreductase subunit 6 (subunit J)